MFPNESWAVTVKPKALPAVGVAVAAARISRLAGAASTVSGAVVERLFAASDAVSVWPPARIKVAEKLPCPLINVESGGSTTPMAVSLLLKWTVPL